MDWGISKLILPLDADVFIILPQPDIKWVALLIDVPEYSGVGVGQFGEVAAVLLVGVFPL